MQAGHVYKKTEIVGTSESSLSDAIERAVERACATLRHVDWFEVVETRGTVRDGRVESYQVVLKIGFRLED
ncbi:MAG TPA: dodecin domain-containing protein [Rhodospirillales bacterium]|nr:dodecin domain-containing protein [Rhodospirillales bacterium]